jgi:hypothetical protein
MFDGIKQLVASSVFEDEDESRVAGLLKTILLTLLGLTLFYGLQTPFSHLAEKLGKLERTRP